MSLPAELNFLEDVLSNPKHRYSKADWLLSDFDDSIWKYSFDFKTPKELNWDVCLDDGLSLLSPKHASLLLAFKYWLIIGTSAKHGTGNLSNALKTQATHFNQIIRYIDYLLLNASDYQLSKTGLAGLTADDMMLILDKIAGDATTNESLFKWSDYLSKYLYDLYKSKDRTELNEIIKNNPDLLLITLEQKDEQLLNINFKEVPLIRAAIMHHGLYKQRMHGLVPNSVTMSREIYKNTVRLKSETKHSFILLEVPRNSSAKREFEMAPYSTRKITKKMSSTHFRYFKDNLYAIGELHTLNLPTPSVEDLLKVYDYQPKINELGRYTTLPSDLIFKSVRNALEFHIEYGEELLQSYLNVAEYCISSSLTPTLLEPDEVVNLITPKIQKIGVKKLGLTTKQPGKSPNDVRRSKPKEHFKSLRANHGLLELINVYYGSVQTVVGALMARRQGELGDLIAGSCLDKTKEWLLFENRKSTKGLYGLRQTEARPIEPIAVEMIETLESFQFSLIDIGAISEPTNLFAAPPISGEIKLSYSGKSTNHRSFDYFCDYFETPLNNNNQRFYIRQHQLRRFFAMLFFYSSSFGGLETLQWMLGHTDRQHVWRYITETTDGPVLRGAKSQYITEYLYNYGDDNYKELSSLIKTRFNTDDFQLVDSNEVEGYISSLLEYGEIEIEPEFFEDENGEQMRVMVKILET